MRKFFLSTTLLAGLLATSATALENPLIGVVNFTTCVSESKAGKKEQENVDNMRKQMASMIEDTEKQLRELTAKFEDTEYLDSLSPKAEEELKMKAQTLHEDLGRYQNQFYQVLNHAHYQMVQKMNASIGKAADKIAHERKLKCVMNKEFCFSVDPDLDVTAAVISEMDKNFEADAKSKATVSENEEQNSSLDEPAVKAG